MSNKHEIYVGDKIERAVQIIGEESNGHDEWVLVNKLADGELDLDIEYSHNYLRVEVNE